MEKLLGILNVLFEECREFILDSDNTPKEQRMEFVVDQMFNMITYDVSVSLEFGKYLLEVMKVIHERRTFEYIEESNANYLIFILVVNELNAHNLIEWGTSIRSCWFNTGKIKFPWVDGEEEIEIKNGDEYIKLIDWIEGKDLE